MNEQERSAQLARFWPRLRQEAHDLYREVGTLRGRIRELERALAASERSLEAQRRTNEKLKASEAELRQRLRAIQQSRGWRMLMKLRRLRHARSASSVSGPAPIASQAASESPPARRGPEPTFAQRWAAEAARRAEASGKLDAWMESARAAAGDIIVVVAGDPSDEHTSAFVEACTSRGEAVCELESEHGSGELRGALPPNIQPSLVPDLLRMDPGGKDRVFVCTVPGPAAIRWFVPAQQDGWTTALILDRVLPAPALVYLATHGDVIVVATDEDARALEEAAGIRPAVLATPTPRDVLEVRRATAPALPRAVLGIE